MNSQHNRKIVWSVIGLCFLTCLHTGCSQTQSDAPLEAGRVHAPLEYRIVSFHQAKARLDLIRLAAELGYNGVMFQQEGANVKGLQRFAANNEREGYVKLCHELGMEVTVWIHEISQLPEKGSDDYLGEVSVDNEKLWNYLADRYDYVLGELLPDIDGLVLTVAETDYWATDTDLMFKLTELLRDKCAKYDKKLIVRTFVHHPPQLQTVLGCVRQLPEGSIIMTKCVPQDWQMRGIHHPAIGAVGDHEEIIEYDIAGEYFLMDKVANAMPDRLKHYFDYEMGLGIEGVCIRADRFEHDVWGMPQEVNLWAMGMYASGATDSPDAVWQAWAQKRYGKEAAPRLIKALKPCEVVVTEMLNVGTLTFGDSRFFPPPMVDAKRSAFHVNWANWRWDEAYVPEYDLARTGDPEYVTKVRKDKERALKLARQSLVDLRKAQPYLEQIEYDILHTLLVSNLAHLEFRSAMMLAYMHYQRIGNTDDPAEQTRLATAIRGYLSKIMVVADQDNDDLRGVNWRGKFYKVGGPLGLEPDKMRQWVEHTEQCLQKKGL